jgi:hypothetical protein
MTTLRALLTAFAPEYLERYPPLPPHTVRLSAPSKTAAAATLAIASLSAHTGRNNTASSTPVATGTVPSASSIKPSSGFITIWRDSFPGRTFSFPLPSPRPYAPLSARINASRTKLCSTPRLSPSSASPKTSVSSAPTSLVSPVSCIPGADSFSTTPTSTTSCLAVASQRTAQPGDPLEPTSLSLRKPSPPSTAETQKRFLSPPLTPTRRCLLMG